MILKEKNFRENGDEKNAFYRKQIMKCVNEVHNEKYLRRIYIFVCGFIGN